MSSFSREQSPRNLSARRSPQLVTVNSRRRTPMSASPRHRARCNRHDARAGLSPSCRVCLVRLSNGSLGPPSDVSLPACTQRRIRSGAASASRLDPLASSGDKRGRCKALFYAVNGTSISDPEPVNFSCDPENWAYRQATSESTAKEIISARISFPARAAFRCSIGFPLPWRATSRNPEDPDAHGDDSSFFAVTQQQWRACVRRMLRCTLACVLPPSLDPRLASGAFAVAKDENRDRFIGHRRPFNSRERSIGRAHLPNCPRLRRLILGKSHTVQITIRDAKDCCYLYEVLPSRVTKTSDRSSHSLKLA